MHTNVSYEGALSTLKSMFEEPWTAEALDAVLQYHEGDTENTVDTILEHGDGNPEELVSRLREFTVSFADCVAQQASSANATANAARSSSSSAAALRPGKKKKRQAEEGEVEKPSQAARKKRSSEIAIEVDDEQQLAEVEQRQGANNKKGGTVQPYEGGNVDTDTSNDAAIAAAAAAEEEHVFYDYTEGGNTYEARVTSYSNVGADLGEGEEATEGGGKFRVEWRKKTVADAAASSPSASEPLCTLWTKLEELTAPSAALAYLEHTDRIPHVQQWEEEVLYKKVKAFRDKLKRDNMILRNVVDEEEAPDSVREVDFCCYLCHCGNRGDDKLNTTTRCGEIVSSVSTQPLGPGSESLDPRDSENGRTYIVSKYHRSCCHGLIDEDKRDKFLSVFGRTYRRFLKQGEVEKGKSKNDCSSSDSDLSSSSASNQRMLRLYKREMRQFLESRTRSAKSRESRTDNDLALAAPDSMRMTDPVAINVAKEFSRICKEREANPDLKHRAVVLDVFSGIGGAEVALKKLGIDICTVITVEHDRVAQHVCRWNHDPSYGGIAKDDIKYVCGLYETFEECEEHLEALVREYGPIDIVSGGPPCQSYSKVNAKRKGADSTNGRYMKDFAKFIARIRKYNMKHHDDFNDLFFFVENVPGSEDATNNYGVSEFRCDAALFGPCYRDRIFYFNWQPDTMPEDEHAAGASTCFVDGWMMPTMFNQGIDAKAMTLLASKGRTKDKTLYKWKVLEEKEDAIEPGKDRPADHGECVLFDTNDRERLMGLPVGYVDRPIQELFTNLRKAFMVGADFNVEWRNTLPPNYWNFLCLGPEGYSFGIDEDFQADDPQRMSLSVKEWNQKSKVCLKDYEYAWHLVGNGFSVPQVMHLLRPLQKLFKRREYPGYTDQAFAWPENDATNNAGGNRQGEAPAAVPVKAASDEAPGGANDVRAAAAAPTASAAAPAEVANDRTPGGAGHAHVVAAAPASAVGAALPDAPVEAKHAHIVAKAEPASTDAYGSKNKCGSFYV